jgi:phosphoglycerate dehydrogenase-like enzyme
MTVQASAQPHQARRAPILPGATVGVLGTGQLGRMFAIAARRMGYRVHAFSPDRDTPTGQVADREVTAAYEDLDTLREFARGVQSGRQGSYCTRRSTAPARRRFWRRLDCR